MIIKSTEVDSFRESSKGSIKPLCDYAKCPRKGTFIVFFTREGAHNQERARVCGEHFAYLANSVLGKYKFGT